MAHFKSDLAKSESLSSSETKCYRLKKKLLFLKSVIDLFSLYVLFSQ